MKILNPICLSTTVFGLAALAGCATAPAGQISADAPDRSGAASDQIRIEDYAQQESPPLSPKITALAISNPSRPAPTATPQTSKTKSTPARFTSPIGLFGEQISQSSNRTDQQGRGNIAQVSFISEGACFDPTTDPTGRRIAFASTMHEDSANIYLQTIGGTTVTQLTSGGSDDVMPTFNPAGDKIAFASNRAGKWDIYVTSADGGPPIQLTNDHDHEIHPSWSPNGRHIAYCKFNSKSGRWEIWAIDVESPGVKRFLDYGMFPKWSPDIASNKILFQRPRQRGSRLHGIWTIDYVGSEATNPTEIVSASNAATINPSWSPDGRRIVFVTIVDPDSAPADRPESSDLWVVNLDGTGRVKVTEGQFANFQPVWARDGNIYFISNRSGTDNIWAVATDRVIDISSPSAVAGVTKQE